MGGTRDDPARESGPSGGLAGGLLGGLGRLRRGGLLRRSRLLGGGRLRRARPSSPGRPSSRRGRPARFRGGLRGGGLLRRGLGRGRLLRRRRTRRTRRPGGRTLGWSCGCGLLLGRPGRGDRRRLGARTSAARCSGPSPRAFLARSTDAFSAAIRSTAAAGRLLGLLRLDHLAALHLGVDDLLQRGPVVVGELVRLELARPSSRSANRPSPAPAGGPRCPRRGTPKSGVRTSSGQSIVLSTSTSSRTRRVANCSRWRSATLTIATRSASASASRSSTYGFVAWPSGSR